ncbi:MAG: hypothetical protein IPG81_18040 [Sandaracinaceae bacterium]|nr:hypothetical protein [Sandaracinaceae bacterium]
MAALGGGTEITVCVENLGDSPELWIGGQRVLITRIVRAGGVGPGVPPCDQVVAHTPPNYAGAAGIQIVASNGQSDQHLGAFTYVDLLEISFINPAVVRVSQAGAGDEVEVVGYGFNPGLRLRAWQSGREETAVEVEPGDDDLRLYSAEKMTWIVPDFGGSYRGFVDVEITDARGRAFSLPNALFYGRLQVDRVITPMAVGLTGPLTPITSHQASSRHRGGPEPRVDLRDGTSHRPPVGGLGFIKYDPEALENAAPMRASGTTTRP